MNFSLLIDELQEKIECQVFDIGGLVTFAVDDNISGISSTSVLTIRNVAAHEGIFLIDHL